MTLPAARAGSQDVLTTGPTHLIPAVGSVPPIADSPALAITTWPPSRRPSSEIIGIYKDEARRQRAVAMSEMAQRMSAAVVRLCRILVNRAF